MDGVLARALAKAPGDRYDSCREFTDALTKTFDLAPYDFGRDSGSPRIIESLKSLGHGQASVLIAGEGRRATATVDLSSTYHVGKTLPRSV